MNRLEQAIIDRARDFLADVLDFDEKQKAGTADDEDRNNSHADHAALSALLEFGHMRDCGMSDEGQDALQEIERALAAHLRR